MQQPIGNIYHKELIETFRPPEGRFAPAGARPERGHRDDASGAKRSRRALLQKRFGYGAKSAPPLSEERHFEKVSITLSKKASHLRDSYGRCGIRTHDFASPQWGLWWNTKVLKKSGLCGRCGTRTHDLFGVNEAL